MKIEPKRDSLMDFEDDIIEEEKDNSVFEENGFDPFIYQNVENEKMDNLGHYLKWHREHPNCSTPRAPRRGVQSQIAAGTTFMCDENSEYAGKCYVTYVSDNTASFPEEFKEKPVGEDAHFDEVSTIVKKYEDFLRYNDYDFDDFEDPWWNMSVKDQVTVTHIEDDSVYEGMINDGSTLKKLKRERDERETEEDKEFVRRGKQNLENLALSKSWGRQPRVAKSPWENDFKRTRFTRDGKEALKEYSIKARELKVGSALEEFKNFSGEGTLGGVTGMSQSEVNDIKMIARFKKELGGLDVMEKMSEEFVKKAVYNRKHMDKGYSVLDGGLDFLDACTKVNAFKAVALLNLGAKPDTLTPEDEPVFVMMLRKVIVSDAMKGATDDKSDKERDRCFKILNALVKHGADLEKWVGNEKALHMVAATGHVELTKWLVENGAVVDGRTKTSGATPMMLAAKYGHAEPIAELMLQDADPNKQDFTGRTALHYAALFGQTKCARFLVKIGVNSRIKDKDLCTAANLATKGGYAVTAQVIMGYAPPFKTGKEEIEFIANQMYGSKLSQEPKTILGKIGKFFNNLFGSASRSGCWSSMKDKFDKLRDGYREFEFSSLFKKKKKDESAVVFPEDDNGTNEEVVEEPAFDF